MGSVKDRRKARAGGEDRKGDTEGQTAAVLPNIAPQLQIPQAARGWGLSQHFLHTHTHTEPSPPLCLQQSADTQATANPTGQSLELLLAFPQQQKKGWLRQTAAAHVKQNTNQIIKLHFSVKYLQICCIRSVFPEQTEATASLMKRQKSNTAVSDTSQ